MEALSEVVTRFGRYEVKEEIGRGAMGVVFKAWDPMLDRSVALKTVQLASNSHPEGRVEFLRRFSREARTAAHLSHPYIVTVYDVGEEGEVPFIAMEFVEGRTLEDLLREVGHLPWERAVELVAQIAKALAHAHDRGVVHRDIKPANILLTQDGQAKVADFGIAKLATSTVTQTQRLAGTPSYMSPEQILGDPVKGTSDIFSLGIILYQLLSGAKPFQGEDVTSICYRIVHQEPTPLEAFPVHLPAGLDLILQKTMAKDPAHRYQRAGELHEDLEGLLRGVAPTRSFSEPERTVGAVPAHSIETIPPLSFERKVAELTVTLGEVLERSWDALGQKGRALASKGVELWQRRRELSRRQVTVLALGAGLILLSLILLLRAWMDPMNRAKRDLKAGRTKAAIEELLKVRARKPESAQVHYQLGEAYLQAERRRAAVKAYQRAMELEPAFGKDNPFLRRLVGLLAFGEAAEDASRLLIQVGDPALPLVEEVLESRRYGLRWNAARTLERMGKRPDYVRLYILDLQYEDCSSRKRAAQRLGELGDRRAIPALLEAQRRSLVENYCMFGALDQALKRVEAR